MPSMSTDPVTSLPEGPVVEFEDGHVRIRELSVDGAPAALARQALEEGRDLGHVVRQALEIGAAVLLHGSAKGTVDAVSAEVERLLSVLSERTARLEFARTSRERMPGRGFSFEADLGAVLDGCFVPHEDVFEATGATKGVAEEKVGDFVLTVNPRDTGGGDRRVVFEAKDRQLSLNKALAELDAAMLNRSAQVGVMVFARAAQAPLRGRPLRVYPGNRILVVWEQEAQGNLALEIASQLARTLAVAVEREGAKLSRRGVAGRVEKLINVVERADAIQRGLEGARRGLDDAQDAYQDMRDDAMTLLFELQDRL